MTIPFFDQGWIWYTEYVPTLKLWAGSGQYKGSYYKQVVNLRQHMEVRSSTKIEDIL